MEGALARVQVSQEIISAKAAEIIFENHKKDLMNESISLLDRSRTISNPGLLVMVANISVLFLAC